MRGLGWRPDKPDERDRLFAARRAGVPRVAESRFDHLAMRVRDQGATSSCVGQSGAAALELRRALDGLPPTRVSALGLYWTCRALDGYQDEDAGAHIRSAARALHRLGIPSEMAWPFRAERVNERPDIAAEVDGAARADGAYERIRLDPELVLDALQNRHPVWFGTQVTDAFMDCNSAEPIPAPKPLDRLIGGHAIVACGFDRGGERVRILNSWGEGYGDLGFAWLATEWFSVPTTSDIWVLSPNREFDGV